MRRDDAKKEKEQDTVFHCMLRSNFRSSSIKMLSLSRPRADVLLTS